MDPVGWRYGVFRHCHGIAALLSLNGRAVVPWLQKTNGAAVGVSGVVEAASSRGTLMGVEL